MKLVGSRAIGNFRSNSDYDVMIDDFIVIVPTAWYEGYSLRDGEYGPEIIPCPVWTDVKSIVSVQELKEKARERFSIPTDAEIDIFVGAYCREMSLYGIIYINNGGFCVGTGNTLEGAELKASGKEFPIYM